jgi:hypothetical protein
MHCTPSPSLSSEWRLAMSSISNDPAPSPSPTGTAGEPSGRMLEAAAFLDRLAKDLNLPKPDKKMYARLCAAWAISLRAAAAGAAPADPNAAGILVAELWNRGWRGLTEATRRPSSKRWDLGARPRRARRCERRQRSSVAWPTRWRQAETQRRNDLRGRHAPRLTVAVYRGCAGRRGRARGADRVTEPEFDAKACGSCGQRLARLEVGLCRLCRTIETPRKDAA